MSKTNIPAPKKGGFDIGAIEALVKQGKTVVSAEDSTIIAAVLRAVEDGKIATFYVTPSQYAQIMRRHWTAERVKVTGIRPISDEEIARIKSRLSLEVKGYSNHIECPKCGHGYGMHEFLAQGIKEHGREAVESVFSLKDMAIVRVNPVQTPVCPNCNLDIVTAIHYYMCGKYGCCKDPSI